MTKQREADFRHRAKMQRIVRFWAAILMALSFCCAHFLPVAATTVDPLPQSESELSEEEPMITVTLTFREMLTNTRYFERESFILPADADLEGLLSACIERGLIREMVFEEELLSSLVFANGVTLAAGGYGEESGFVIMANGKNRLPFMDFTLEDGMSYQLNYRLSKADKPGIQLQTEDVQQVELWDEQLEAMLDSACSWLYQNRPRGSTDAVMALGVANRSANPTDVVLLTQFEGIDSECLSELTEYFLALAYCGYSPPIYENQVLFSQFINFADPKDCTTAELCDVMRFCDSFSFTVDSGAKLSQEAIIGELLLRQNIDGGFSSNREGGSNIPTTAEVITVLQGYRDLDVVQDAVLGGISYLSSPAVRDLLFEGSDYTDCVTIAQMILAICCCELPMQDVYFTYNGKTYADLLQNCFCVSGGFSMRAGGVADAVATAAAIEALCALRKGGDPYLREDAVLVSFLVSSGKQELQEPPSEETPTPTRRISSGFWLAVAFTVSMILVEVIHYILYRRQVDRME